MGEETPAGKKPEGKAGNHAKFFIVDKKAYYMGSQNLYIANLGEWGVLVDDESVTQQILSEYWNPLWAQSFVPTDCDPDEVMDGLGIDRDGDSINMRHLSPEMKQGMLEV